MTEEKGQSQLARELGIATSKLTYIKKKLGLNPRKARNGQRFYNSAQIQKIEEYLAARKTKRTAVDTSAPRLAPVRRVVEPSEFTLKLSSTPAPKPAFTQAREEMPAFCEPELHPAVREEEPELIKAQRPALPRPRPRRKKAAPAVPNGDALLRGVKRKRAVRWLRDGFHPEVVQRTLRLTDAQLQEAERAAAGAAE